MERNDRPLLKILQPRVPGNPAVMLVDPAAPLAPAVELISCHTEPPDELPGADLGPLRPAPDKVHDLVPVSCGTQTRVWEALRGIYRDRAQSFCESLGGHLKTWVQLGSIWCRIT